MKDAAVCIRFLLAFVLAMCGGPQLVADLLKPSLGDTPQGLRVTHRDEEGMFEPGRQPLWQSRLVDGKWSTRRLRAMDYKGAASPNPRPEIPRDLPPGMQPPQFGNIAIIVET